MTDWAERQRRYRERQYAAGRHYVRGRLTDQPRQKRRPGEEPPHGTRARYIWSRNPCRCDECRRASSDDARRRRHQRNR